jgi:signal transduction histidine kinase
VKQVFVNVLTNAVHAMPQGGTLTLRTYAKTLASHEVDRDAGSRLANRFRAGETVVVAEVIDTGTGVSADKLAHVFDPFFTTKGQGKGTGLGLTVAKQIVELHGGTIQVTNRAAGGFRVSITFPTPRRNEHGEGEKTNLGRG